MALRDRDDFRTFYDLTLPVVHGYFVRRCVGGRTIADDLTQETYLAAVQQLRRGPEPEQPRAWLLGIARHKLVDHYRRHERTERNATLAAFDGRRTVQLAAIEDPRATEVLEALANTPPDQRLALVLHHMDDLPVAQVAEIIGRSVRATESLLARARASFATVYGKGAVDA